MTSKLFLVSVALAENDESINTFPLTVYATSEDEAKEIAEVGIRKTFKDKNEGTVLICVRPLGECLMNTAPTQPPKNIAIESLGDDKLRIYTTNAKTLKLARRWASSAGIITQTQIDGSFTLTVTNDQSQASIKTYLEDILGGNND